MKRARTHLDAEGSQLPLDGLGPTLGELWADNQTGERCTIVSLPTFPDGTVDCRFRGETWRLRQQDLRANFHPV